MPEADAPDSSDDAPPDQDERYVPGSVAVHYEHEHRYLAARSVVHNARVVDLASGEGYGAAWLAARAAQVVGVERHRPAVEDARRRYRARNLRYICGDITQAPLAGGSADVVVCFEAIEHVEEPKDVVAEIARLLTPSGMALVSTPDRRIHTDVLGIDNPYHVSEMDIDELLEILRPRFEAVVLLGQTTVSASCLWPLDEPHAQRSGAITVAESLATPEVAKEGGLTAGTVVAVCGRADDPRIQALQRLDVFTDDELHFASTGAVAGLRTQVAALRAELEVERARAGRGAQRLLALQPAMRRLLRELDHQQEQIARLQDRPIVPDPEPEAPAPPTGRARSLLDRVRRMLRGR